MSYYTKNKEIILKRKIELESIFDNKKQSKKNDIKCYAHEAKDGTSFMEIHIGNEYYRMNSCYNPIQETNFWVSQFDFNKELEVISFFGLGNGDFARSIIKNMKEDACLIIVEPSKEVFLSAIKLFNMVDIFNNPKVFPIVLDVNEEFWSNVLGVTVQWENLYNQIICDHPKYAKIFPSEYEKYINLIMKNYERVSVNRNTEAYFGKKYAINMIESLQSFPKINSLLDCRGLIPTKVPAIIIAAGPSLDDNVRDLKNAKQKAVLIATDRCLPTLFKNNIIPDFIITVDPDKADACFANPISRKVPLIITAHAKQGIIKRHEGRIFLVSCYEYINNLAKKMGSEIPYVDTGASVATTAFSICLLLGFKTIIFVGQDLAFKGNVTHTGGEEEKAYLDNVKYVEGVNGDVVRTRSDWEWFRFWFEQNIKVVQGEIEVIDATEGGALIHGTKVMTLKKAIQYYCKMAFDVQTYISNIPLMCIENKYPTLINYVKDGIEECKEVITIAEEVIVICKNALYQIRNDHVERSLLQSNSSKIVKANESIQNMNIFQLIDLSIFSSIVEKHENVNTKPVTEVEAYQQFYVSYNQVFLDIIDAVKEIKVSLENQLEIIQEV